MGNPHTAPLGDLIVLVDDLESRLTAARATKLDNLDMAITALNDLSEKNIRDLKREGRFLWNAATGSFITSNGNTWTKVPSNAHFLGQYVSNTDTPTQNDAIGIGSFYSAIPALGFYCYIICSMGSDRGILTLELNNVSKGTFDMYSGGEGNNQAISIDLGDLVTKVYGIKLAMNSKNGSSSGYVCKIQSVFIYPY